MNSDRNLQQNWDELRNKITGLGDNSSRKSYFPELQQRLQDQGKFRALLNKTSDAIIQVNIANGLIIDLNDAGCCLLENEKDTLINYSVNEAFFEDLLREYKLHLSTVLSGQEHIFTLVHNYSDKESFIEFLMQSVYFDHEVYVVIVGRDITKQKKAEDELRESKRDFEELLQNIPTGVYRIRAAENKVSKFEFVSNRFTEIVESSIEDLYDNLMNAYNKVEEEDLKALFQMEECAKSNLSIIEWVGRIYTSHGLKWLSIKSTPKLQQNGDIIWNGIVNDITLEKQIEEQRKSIQNELLNAKEKAEESDRLKTAFLNNMSHEIRTPLNGIVGFTDFMTLPDISQEERMYYSRIIHQNCNQLTSIIDDIIKISTIEAGQEVIREKKININETLNHLYAQFNIRIDSPDVIFNYKTSLKDEKAEILTDATKVIQVLSNLISNAIKFTSKGSIEFGYELIENKLQFYVRDSGIGIESKYHDLIFERFRQVKTHSGKVYGGNGLGLAISKAYVELLGGKIWLRSILGIGTTFYFTLPYTPVKKDYTLKSSTKPIRLDKSTTILIVEDEFSNYVLIEKILERIAVKSIHCMNGINAIEEVRGNPDIKLVLMDMKMPEMDGFEATQQIKAIRKDLPIIAQTAYTLDSDINKAINAGCSEVLVKPYKSNDLLEIILKYC